MKNVKMKIIVLALTSITNVSISCAQEEMTLPVVSSPLGLHEGTQRELTPSQLAELIPWAKDSKIFITDLIDQASSLPMEQKLELLIEGAKQVISESAPKNSELLMRYSLNRALVVVSMLDQELDSASVGAIDAKSRVMLESLKMSVKYYESDMRTLSSKAPIPFAQFGIEYFQFLTELNKSIFDASAQYNVQRLAFEFLQWDLYRDLNNTSHAPKIVKINNSLKMFPKKKMPDGHAINNIRQMRKTIEQLGLKTQVEIMNSQNESLFSTKTGEESVNKRNYKFINYNDTPGGYLGGCYQVANNGVIMYEQGLVSSSLCGSRSYKYYDYNSTPGKNPGGCYQKSHDGKTMWEQGVVSFSNCGSSNYRYVNYEQTPGIRPGGCYQISNNGITMWEQGIVSGKCN